jgi:hypothetical protein
LIAPNTTLEILMGHHKKGPVLFAASLSAGIVAKLVAVKEQPT